MTDEENYLSVAEFIGELYDQLGHACTERDEAKAEVRTLEQMLEESRGECETLEAENLRLVNEVVDLEQTLLLDRRGHGSPNPDVRR